MTDLKKAQKKFAARLKRTLDGSGRYHYEIAEAVGLSRTTIAKYLQAGSLPTIKIAANLAKVLGDNELAHIVMEFRTKSCVICKKTFIDEGSTGSPRVACSQNCRVRYWYRRNKHQGVRNGTITEHRWEEVIEKVAAFCHDCGTNGVCPDARCHLRGISPLPVGLTEQLIQLEPRRKKSA